MIATLTFDLIQTLAVASGLYYLGVLVKRRIPVLDRLNIPSAVIGGMLFACIVLVTHDRFVNMQFDTSTQPLFMVAFFTSVGMSASIPLLKAGGKAVLVFLAVSSAFCFIQNGVGIAVAELLGVHPLLGVMAGSVTLVGGPATGMAFAPVFEKAGLSGAAVLAITAATFGIVFGGITGGPLGTWLITRGRLHPAAMNNKELQRELAGTADTIHVEIEREDSSLIVNLVVASIAMGIGSVISTYFQSLGLTLPGYIGAMMVGSLLRNIDDRTHRFRIGQKEMELIGGIALNIFLVVALMNLRLWELFNLALPLMIILLVQVIIVLVFALVVFRLMGKDYDAAVMSGGFIGFMLGTTANAIANMKTLVARYGPSPRAFLVVPIIGAFFIDFVNALVITLFVNWVA